MQAYRKPGAIFMSEDCISIYEVRKHRNIFERKYCRENLFLWREMPRYTIYFFTRKIRVRIIKYVRYYRIIPLGRIDSSYMQHCSVRNCESVTIISTFVSMWKFESWTMDVTGPRLDKAEGTNYSMIMSSVFDLLSLCVTGHVYLSKELSFCFRNLLSRIIKCVFFLI